MKVNKYSTILQYKYSILFLTHQTIIVIYNHSK